QYLVFSVRSRFVSRGFGRFADFLDDGIGKIAPHREHHLEMPSSVYDQCAEVVIVERAVTLVSDIRLPRQLRNLVGRASEKTPMGRVVMVKLAVRFKDFWRIVFGIKGDGEEMPVRRAGGIRREFLGGFLKIPR